MNTNEVLKLALEALEYIYEGANNQGPHTGLSWRCVSNKAEPAITALRQALANEALDKKAENARELGLDYEPVWDNLPSNKDVEDAMRLKRLSQLAEQPAQRTWVGLTDEEWQDLSDRYGLIIWGPFKREIEAKLREKNT